MELGVGILGFGFMGRTHTYGLINIPLHYDPLPFRIKHISVCNPGEKKRKAAESLGYYRKVTPDYRELVEDPEIDVICVASPNGAHKEQLLAAIQAGKHIYCDKPITSSLAEAEEVKAALANSSYAGKHQMILQYRFFPAVMRAKQLIDEGFLGKIFHYRSAYLHASNVDPTKPLSWKADPARGGGGTMFDMGVHLLDMMGHLLGPIEAVNTTFETCVKERPSGVTGKPVPVTTDDAALMVVRHTAGTLGLLEASKVATGTLDELKFEIHGELGAMRFNLMDPNWLEVYDTRDAGAPIGGLRGFKKVECVQQYPKPANGFPSAKASIGWIRAHMHCLYNLLACVGEDREADPSLLEGIQLQRVLEAGQRSAEKGLWVRVDEVTA